VKFEGTDDSAVGLSENGEKFTSEISTTLPKTHCARTEDQVNIKFSLCLTD
jgi:hypothetical protein